MTELVIYGANGATGSRLAEIAVAAGLRPVLAGRDGAALERIAGPLGLDVRVGTLDPAELDSVCRDAAVVVSCVAPYATRGIPVLEAALRHGAHYIDFTGEPHYVRRLIDDYDARARQVGSALLPSAGVGLCTNIAARAAADGVPAVERLTVDWRIRRYRPSWGSITSGVQVLAGGAAVVDRGRLSFRPSGTRIRRLAGGLGVLFPTTDTLTLSRLWPEASIESYLRTPVAVLAAPALAVAGLAARRELFVRQVDRVARARRAPDGKRPQGQFEVTVTAEGASRCATATADVLDVYEFTSQAAFELAQTLLEHGATGGVRASGEIVGNPDEVAQRIGVTLAAPPPVARNAKFNPERVSAAGESTAEFTGTVTAVPLPSSDRAVSDGPPEA
jgi:short subunit dehydrogenase-like uncharacterized protein